MYLILLHMKPPVKRLWKCWCDWCVLCWQLVHYNADTVSMCQWGN